MNIEEIIWRGVVVMVIMGLIGLLFTFPIIYCENNIDNINEIGDCIKFVEEKRICNSFVSEEVMINRCIENNEHKEIKEKYLENE